jgi:hypothetical protein
MKMIFKPRHGTLPRAARVEVITVAGDVSVPGLADEGAINTKVPDSVTNCAKPVQTSTFLTN